MSVDWFTIAAQAVNFLILLWLMKIFLFKPILKAIDAREKSIADDVAKAENMAAAAQKEQQEYEVKNEEIDQQAAAILKQAQDEGNTEKLQLLQAARDTATAISEKRQEALVVEETALREAVSRRIQHEVLATTRKVLADLAEANLEEQMVRLFLQRLHDLDESDKKTLIAALEAESATATIRTAFKISLELHSTLKASITALSGTQITVDFMVAPDLICGIELAVSGQKVAWSIADYLSLMEEGRAELFKAAKQ